MATQIELTDLTNGTLNTTNEWTGTGIFDKLIEAVNKNIEGQYQLGRITATDYANVYLGSMQSVIAESMQYLLQEKQVEAQTDLLINQDKELTLNGISKRNIDTAQEALIERQKKGFDDNAYHNLLKQVLDSWSVGFSVSQTAVSIPNAIKVSSIDSVMNQAAANLGITI